MSKKDSLGHCQPLHHYFLIKPASGHCNLACRYCFYRDLREQRRINDFGIMSRETVKKLIERVFELDSDIISFAFQGGEPTLAGLDFFKYFINIVREYAADCEKYRKDRPLDIRFSIQTNGILVDKQWAEFFKKEQFLIGLSLDGPRLLHNSFRVKEDDSATYSAVIKAFRVLQDYQIPVNALCVVHAAIADNAEAVYQHLRACGFDWIQFIPCLPPLVQSSANNPWSLSSMAYAGFLCKTFDLWYEEWQCGIPVHIRWFENITAMAMGIVPESCGMAGCCSINFTIEADGSVYPCDFYVIDDWKLGSIHEHSFEQMRSGNIAQQFQSISQQIDKDCKTCFAFPLCRGGCRRDREPLADDVLQKNRYCTAFKEFFSYAGERIMYMAKNISKSGF